MCALTQLPLWIFPGSVLWTVGILLFGIPTQQASTYLEPTAAEDISSLDLCQTTFNLIPVFILLRGVVASTQGQTDPPGWDRLGKSQWDAASPIWMLHGSRLHESPRAQWQMSKWSSGGALRIPQFVTCDCLYSSFLTWIPTARVLNVFLLKFYFLN